MSTTDRQELERLRKEYNAAVANGLIMKARRINRVMASIERDLR